MMRERLDADQRSTLLQFVWGRSRLPLCAEDFESNMKLQCHSYDNEGGNAAAAAANNKLLPIAHTCFFSLGTCATAAI
jgi:hypothetical protein